MAIKIHPHARERMKERGASVDEISKVVEMGEKFPGKYGRTGFRRNFSFNGLWRGKRYHTKQIEVFAIEEGEDLIVISVIVKYF